MGRNWIDDLAAATGWRGRARMAREPPMFQVGDLIRGQGVGRWPQAALVVSIDTGVPEHGWSYDILYNGALHSVYEGALCRWETAGP